MENPYDVLKHIITVFAVGYGVSGETYKQFSEAIETLKRREIDRDNRIAQLEGISELWRLEILKRLDAIEEKIDWR